MNPLDPQELQPFIRNMQEEMPIHTESTAKIKRSYSQGMPKNLMEYSAFVDNHFLNDNLSVIEEMAHRDAKHPIPKWFRDYQIKHFAKFGILKKDRFFTTRMRDGYRKHFAPDLTETREIGYLPYAGTTLGFGSIGDTKVFGSELETGSTSTTVSESSWVFAGRATGGVINSFYDQIALNYQTGGNGNHRMACYTDVSNLPNTLYAETSSIATATGYSYKSITEFELLQTSVWLAFAQSSSSDFYYLGNTASAMKYQSQSYGAFPNPFSLTNSNPGPANMKIKHS